MRRFESIPSGGAENDETGKEQKESLRSRFLARIRGKAANKVAQQEQYQTTSLDQAIEIDTSQVHKVNVQQENPVDVMGPNTRSFRTDLTGNDLTKEEDGESGEHTMVQKRSSNWMLSAREEDAARELPNEYVNAKQMKEALMRAIEALPDDAKFVGVVAGKKDIRAAKLAEKVMIEALKNGTYITLTDSTGVFPNQNSDSADLSYRTTRGANGERKGSILGTRREKHLGQLMEGKNKIGLDEGVYISMQDVEDALRGYMVQMPVGVGEGMDGEGLEERGKPQRVVERRKLNDDGGAPATLILAGLGLAAAALMSVSISSCKPTVADSYPSEPTPAVEVANNGQNDSDIYVAEKDALEQERLGGLKIGDVVEVKDGIVVHESSDYDRAGANREGEAGRTFPPGDYVVEAFAAVTDDVAGTERGEGKSLQEFSDKMTNEVGSNDVRVHLADKNGDWIGWVNRDDLGTAMGEDQSERIVGIGDEDKISFAVGDKIVEARMPEDGEAKPGDVVEVNEENYEVTQKENAEDTQAGQWITQPLNESNK